MQFTPERVREFENYVTSFMAEHDAPGISIAIAQGDQVVYSNAFGYRQLAEQIPVTPGTIFGIASITKAFTAVAIAQLVEQGVLSFDDPVSKYLPDFKPHNGAVTIRHFLTHTSGLPPLPSLTISMRDNTPAEPPQEKKETSADQEKEKDKEKTEQPVGTVNNYHELVDYIAKHPYQPLGQPGEYFSYSNDCYGLLGAIIMQVTGLTYTEYMRRHVFLPLGMTRTCLGVEEMREYPDVTDLYYRNEEQVFLHSTRWQVSPPFLAGGAIKSTALDLIRFWQMYALGGKLGDVQLLGEDYVRENITPRYRYSLYDSYAHGLRVRTDYHGVTLAEHGGSKRGVSSNAGFVPERGISAVVLCNLTGVPISKVWLAAINLGLGLPVTTPRVRYETTEWPASEAQAFLGTYKSGEGATFDLIITDELTIKFKHEQCVVKKVNATTGLYVLRGQESELKFYTNAQGQVWGVGLGVRIIPKVS